jgi:hypothetical protein
VKKIVLALTACLFAFAAFAQQHGKAQPRPDTSTFKSIPCVGFDNPNRIKYIKEGKILNVFMVTDSQSVHEYTGPVFLGDSALVILGPTEIYHGYSEAEATYIERQTNYRRSEFISIQFKNVDYLSYTQKAHKVFGTIFGVTLTAAILSVPLAAVNYGTKTFNSQTVLFASAGAALTSFVFSKVFNERKYRVKRK